MTKTSTAFLFAASLLFTAACDAGEDPIDSERAAEANQDSPDDVRGHHADHAKRGEHAKFMAEKLCGELECSDDQATAVAELFASRHEGKSFDEAEHEARKAARAEAHKAIADAFRADEFDRSVLERAKDGRRGGDHEAEMLAFAVELHALLTPEQRAKLADTIAKRGPMFMGPGKRGHHGDHHGKKGKKGRHGEGQDSAKGERDPADRIAHKVERFCEPIDCSEAQQTQLAATFEGVHEAHREAREGREKPDFSALADAFRGEALDEAKLQEAMRGTKAEHEARRAEHGKELGAVVAEIHDILTPEQRAIIAAQIEAHGVGAVLGKRDKHGKHGKHGKRGKHGKHGKRGGDAPSELAAD